MDIYSRDGESTLFSNHSQSSYSQQNMSVYSHSIAQILHLAESRADNRKEAIIKIIHIRITTYIFHPEQKMLRQKDDEKRRNYITGGDVGRNKEGKGVEKMEEIERTVA